MRVLICWTRISGYATACWKRLTEQPDIDVRVVAWDTRSQSDNCAFQQSLVEGLNCRLLRESERTRLDILNLEVSSFRPDVVVIPGWMSPAYSSCVERWGIDRPMVVMGMDTPWQGRFRQNLTKYRFRKLFHQVDQVVVAGERTWQYARRIGFPEHRIFRGLYAFDDRVFNPVARDANRQEKRLLYVGRLSPEKGIETLIGAYSRYRATHADPWPLTVCGTGPLRAEIERIPGVDCRGFVQPKELPEVFRECDVMILPSLYEPWGVVVAEAMGAGLPVIATEASGAAIDLIRPYWNGLLAPTGSESGLETAIGWFHRNADQLPAMGGNASAAAEPYSARNWAVRWRQMLNGMADQNRNSIDVPRKAA